MKSFIKPTVSGIALVLIATFLSSCSMIDGYETIAENIKKNAAAAERNDKAYTIPAGNHSATHGVHFVEQAERISFTASFDSSAIYKTVNANNQGDINKLYGLSDHGSQHQENSARFGWRWYEGKLEIWAYAYNNGERKLALVDSMKLNQSATFEISFGENVYVFKVGNKTVQLPRACSGKASGYRLYPYFGGDETAPHNITIQIKDM
ncbi:hypothetical protein KK083_02125 [Fulvivirgaceae bacterium PWU4]|uniref:Lipoprotein n=1 Tax=Chryseosolibacter histidini TaxID=2782349 RepID=A0AAP2DG86_9BACT|nr:hypothetical protein [Chryseosolibacter histidini]MBT1695655.1 hypothetical protein [Chryseosolibacter histidini]